MPPRPAPSRIAQALEYLQGLKSGVGEFVGGVGSNLADRARAAGGLAYEALTTDPNIGRMTTAEFSQAAADRAPTPRLDQAARDIGTIGRAIVTQPVETGKAIVGGEIDRFKGAFASPQALGDYAGSLIDPMRLAAALRHRVPISELDVYHGTPHKYAPTEANPLGEFDASKIGTGEGAQAYGHGIYLAETPEVASMYRASVGPKDGSQFDLPDGPIKGIATMIAAKGDEGEKAARKLWASSVDDIDEAVRLAREAVTDKSSLYKADLPDEMIDRMLDWDKPLSEQPAAVREALMPIVKAAMKKRGTPDRALEYSANRAIGGDIVKDLLVGNGVTRAEVSRRLQQAGIPGIRYLDAGSRDGGSGTRNFVVFPGEEKKVRILERNGQPAPERIAQALEAAPVQFPMPEKTPRGAKLTMMSPQDYLRQVNEAQGIDFQSAPLPIRKPNTIRDLTKAIKAGEPIETPSLTMQKGKIVDQEGRHRAVAAIQAGVQQIPVFVFERK